MPEIAPSERVRQELRDVVGGGSQQAPISQFIRLAAQRVVQEMLEQEATDFPGRERYERWDEEQRGYRRSAIAVGGWDNYAFQCP